MAVKTKKSKKTATREAISSYCMGCSATVEIDDYKVEQLISGRKLARATCPNCGTSISRMMKAATPVDFYQTKAQAKENKNKKEVRKKQKRAEVDDLKERARAAKQIENVKRRSRVVTLKRSSLR